MAQRLLYEHGNKRSDIVKPTKKELELRSELYKESPDVSKAGTLQKEISELESELDQKRIIHMIKIRKLNPNAGRGFMMGGYHMGYGNSSNDPCLR